ncbi:MAG: hypothetical protein J6A57_07215 [Ruminococcus sp.]|nr:hypothetical protein [Ruminococcus sp.]
MKLFDLAKDFFFQSDEEDELNESAAYDEEPRQERPARSTSASSASSYSSSSSSCDKQGEHDTYNADDRS